MATSACYRAYVVNQRSNDLAVLDCTGHRLGAVAVGLNPHEVVLTPNGATAYTSDMGAGTISEIDLPSLRRTHVVSIGGEPHGLAIGQGGRVLFVTAEQRHEVDVLALPELTLRARLRVGISPHMLYPTPDRAHALVTDPAGGDVALLDLAHPGVLWTAVLPGSPEGAAIGADGGLAYVLGRGSGELVMLSLKAHPGRILAHFPVGAQPIRIALSADGREAYVTLFNSARLQIVDLGTRQVVASVRTGSQPVGVSLAPDGRLLWIGNLGARTVTVIDRRSRRVLRTVTAGDGPDGIVFGA